MGYNIEISINILKETKISEKEFYIKDIAKSNFCDNIFLLNEVDGTNKIPVYKCIYIVEFNDDKFDFIIQFIKQIKKIKSLNIECVFNNSKNYLIYASSFYLQNINVDISKKYKKYKLENNFLQNDKTIIDEFY